MANSSHPFSQGSFLTILFSLVGLGVIVLAALRLLDNTAKNNFCTPTDGVYQTIQVNLDIWIENYFRPNQSSSTNHLDFSIATGEKYTAIGMEPNSFFVVTEYDSPHSYLGLKGYIYSPNNLGQIYPEYRYIPLGKDLFCYESKF